ncbi:MAG: UDP-N-acetylglucosamine 2-epimerase [Planctomycetota bacterium]
MPKRTIAIVTGTRAEYGLLEPVMAAVGARPGLSLQLIVTGTHLVTDSIRDIRFPIAARVRMQKKVSDTFSPFSRAADVQALSRGISGLGKAFERLEPDVVVVLGDRIEAFAAATAASIGGYRIAHLHGGDRAEGVADEAMRHAISKLSHLHFPATAQSRKRLIRMGENPANVWKFGSPAIDALKGVKPAEDAPALIVMQHPVGASEEDERRWMNATLKATAKYDRLVMSPNHDPGRSGILAAITDYGIQPVDHLPRPRFLELLAGAKAIVGNSSAGLIEAAALRTPAVNIGPRQAGRERPRSVVDTKPQLNAIRLAIRDALSMDTRQLRHPYGNGMTGPRIAEAFASIDLNVVPINKHNLY